ncbi:unnamed protein product, partial [Ranitomeya imitator]
MRAKEDEELSKKDVELLNVLLVALCTSVSQDVNAESIYTQGIREKTRLEQLQLEQRLMEEKNKRKKALLAKAIAE